MPLKSLGLAALPKLMRLHTSGCSANNCRLLAWGPGVIPCPELCLHVYWLLDIISLSLHTGMVGKGVSLGRERRGERSHGWVLRGAEPRACASLASSTESCPWPRADRSCELHPEQGNVQRRLKCADPEYGSNPVAPGCCCDSDDKPCL